MMQEEEEKKAELSLDNNNIGEAKKEDNDAAATAAVTTNGSAEEAMEAVDLKEGEAEGEASMNASHNTSTESTVLPCNGDPPILRHKFSPGDHVIRWEMLPILWPIQIHGIVLETGKGYVSICDFGLTAEPRHDLKVEEAAKEAQANKDKDSTSTATMINSNTKLAAHWEKVKPPDNTKKERITVHLITEQDELKAWKKVNYGQGLFGTGPEEDNMKDTSQMDNLSEDMDMSSDNQHGRAKTPIKQRMGQWWQNVKQQRQQKKKQQQGKTTGIQAAESNDSTENSIELETATAANSEPFTTEEEKDTAADAEDRPKTPTKSSPVRKSSSVPDLRSPSLDDEDNANDDNAETTQAPPPKSPLRRRMFQSMMGARANNKSRSNSPVPKSKGDSTLSQNNNQNSNTPPKNKLPKSDPPKLVLARTTFLLSLGEKILPPYHPFKANSECIAVFCKTGRWSTLQASVFLHSTAIGNAKSSMAVTLGVAASMPLLAPAIAGIGMVAVGAPYVILNQSKEFWQHETLRLNDAFWAQAEPEVFIECIEHWTKLEEYHDWRLKLEAVRKQNAEKAQKKEEQDAQEATTTTNGAETTKENDNNHHDDAAPSAEMDASAKSVTKTDTSSKEPASPMTPSRRKERFVSV